MSTQPAQIIEQGNPAPAEPEIAVRGASESRLTVRRDLGTFEASISQYPEEVKPGAAWLYQYMMQKCNGAPAIVAAQLRKIDPKTYWKYTDGATHGANEIAVSSGQVDMTTDFDRNRNAMIASGKIKENSNKIIWTSAPLPNDAIALPKSAPKELGAQVQKILTAITDEQAKTLLPPRYTGFVAANHASYEMIEKAGIALGKIKPKA